MSTTNIDLDDRILKEAGKLTHLKTRKEIVNYALEELVKRLRRKRSLNLKARSRGKGIVLRCEGLGYDCYYSAKMH